MNLIFTWIKKAVKWGFVAGSIIILLAGGYIAILAISSRKTLDLPVPSGQYAVGRVELDWTDTQRIDPLTDQDGLKRELPVWVWYPARVDPSQKPAPYLPPAWSSARGKDQGIGILIENQSGKIQTHSYENVPLDSSQSAYPVLIMAPGMGPAIPDYTILAENLASHGFIVVGINPTYTSFLVSFPDGRITPRSAKGTIPDSASREQADQIGNQILSVWVQDEIFVMNRLQAINETQGDPFYRRLDLDHTGVFGHSFGGATAIAVCQQDPRCKAGANLDGTPFSAEVKGVIPIPFLLISEDYPNGCDENCTAFRKTASQVQPGPVISLSIQGTGHFNFSDLPVRQVPATRPLFQAAHLTGSIDPIRGEQITNAYLVAFFDRYLKNIDTDLLKGPTPLYPEVQFH